jgi:hypothetical protein
VPHDSDTPPRRKDLDSHTVEMIYYLHNFTQRMLVYFKKKEQSCIFTEWLGEIRKWALMTIAERLLLADLFSHLLYVTTLIGAILLRDYLAHQPRSGYLPFGPIPVLFQSRLLVRTNWPLFFVVAPLSERTGCRGFPELALIYCSRRSDDAIEC